MQAALWDEPAGLLPLAHVVLVEPQIPANTGNVARTCAALGASLHLVGHTGFTLTDAAVRRAGLDYWPGVDLHWHPCLEDLAGLVGNPEAWLYFTARTSRGLHDVPLARGQVLVFGREDTGLPETLLQQRASQCVRLPMRTNVRSLNLSVCAAVSVFEVLRQVGHGGAA